MFCCCCCYCCFSLLLLNIFSLYLIFINLSNIFLSMFLLGLILYGTPCASWTWMTVPFPTLGKFSTIISSNIFSGPFPFTSSSGAPVIQMSVWLKLFHTSLRLSSFLFILFSLFCSMAEISYHSVFQVTYPFFCLRYSAIGSFQYIFHFSYYSSLFVL